LILCDVFYKLYYNAESSTSVTAIDQLWNLLFSEENGGLKINKPLGMFTLDAK